MIVDFSMDFRGILSIPYKEGPEQSFQRYFVRVVNK